MDNFDWEVIIKRIFFVMKILGLWPADKKGYKLDMYLLWTVVFITVVTFGHPFFQTANMVFIIDDLQLLVSTIYVSLTELLITIKALLTMANMKTLKDLIATIKSQTFKPRNERQISLIQPAIESWKKISIVYWSMGMSTVFFMSVYPIFDNSELDYKLPFIAWYPFNTRTSPNYEITYFYQALGVTVSANTGICVDLLIAALHVIIGAQFDIMSDQIKYLAEEDEVTVKAKLVECVEHHKSTLKFAESSARFSKWIILGQFFISAVSIGLTMFQLTTAVPFSNEFFSFVAYLCAMTMEIFIYCWFGNEVEIKSSEMMYAVFESDWTGMSQEFKMYLIFLSERCRMPLKISALNLFYLSLETFVRILRAAWSYFALLYQVSSTK